MKRLFFLLILVLSSLCLNSPCYSQGPQPYLIPNPVNQMFARMQPLDEIVAGNSKFAFQLYHLLKNRKENVFFSPYNISATFALAVAGARGETAKEMERVLNLPNGIFALSGELNEQLKTPSQIVNPSTQLSIANAIWVQQGMPLLPSFELTMQHTLGSTLNETNFTQDPIGSAKAINQWVVEQTRGKIHQLLTPQDFTIQTRMVLTSAIYLKAPWLHPFNPRQTTKAPFYTNGQKSVTSLMMQTTNTFPLFVDDKVALMEIPYNYQGDEPQLSMVVVLPHENVGLNTLEQSLNFEQWTNWKEQMQPKKVRVSFPKFRVETRLDLNETMKELGMVKAFSPHADFSAMTGVKGLFINKAIHKTYIKLDEVGVEAAAATGITMGVTSVLNPEEPIDFIVNRPFLFLIIDHKTQSILFMGRILQP